ncbi:MAG: hydrogen peroxide-inducible genes activator [Planctomycetes bacterium]|nr:hydrogen peroxide-inducible genes activator [Planctomycetota bacterium]
MTIQFTLRQLEYAVAVATHGGFGTAAKACFVSQPALSAQVGQLETILGTQLFERGPRGAALTPAGETLIPRARELLLAASELEAATHTCMEPLTGELRIGIIPTVAPFLLPRLVPLLHDRHPTAKLTLVEAMTDTLQDRLLRGELDVLLVATEADLDACELLEIFRDSFLVVLPEGHPLAQREDALTLEDIKQEPLLLLEEGHCLSRQVADVCRLQEADTGGNFRASSLVTLLSMVAIGRGITLLPSMARTSDIAKSSGLVLRELAGDAFRTIGLAWRPSSPRRVDFELLARLVDEAAP